MKYKRVWGLACASTVILWANSALATQPSITLFFSDPLGLCKKQNSQTQLAFNYQYFASGGIEFYSGPVDFNSPQATIAVRLPPDDGAAHNYLDFEITSQGDCGDMELDYQHLGSCYRTNLIPEEDRDQPYSYKITLTPHATGNSTYGIPMYNLTCSVSGFSSSS